MSDRLLDCAREEFLAKGYEEASLREIAQNAGTSTGSIYTRFKDKAGLFDALVSPSVQGLLAWFRGEEEAFRHLSSCEQALQAYTYGEKRFSQFVDYVYDRFDDFRLVLCCSQGSGYMDFIEELVKTDMEYTRRFIQETGSDAFTSGRLEDDFMHMLTSAFYSGIFETVVHNMSRQKAYGYVGRLRRFYICGWKDILRISP